MKNQIYIGRTVGAFLLVLLLMPMGHALMILMEHFLALDALHYCSFAIGFAGMVIVIMGMYVKGDAKQTLFGLFGGLLFWTGWVEFLFAYYAWRYGVHCDLVGDGIVQTTTTYLNGVGVNHDFLINGESLEAFTRPELKAIRGSRPEYLIMPATFGMWMMMAMLYLFGTRTGCRFFCWLQNHLHLRQVHAPQPGMVRHSSLVTFLELNMMMWTFYIVLMFCYDPVFLGSSHPVTFGVGFACLVSSAFMLWKQLHVAAWGANIRMAVATVLVFWTFVEVVARNGLLNEIWVDPMNHIAEMLIILAAFVVVSAVLFKKRKR